MPDENDSTERWLPVVGWDGFYEVSDRGGVRSVDRIRTDPGGRVRRYRGRTLRGFARQGYLWVGFSNGARREKRSVHRMVLTAFVGPAPAGKHAAHFDGSRDNNRIENLRWATPAENAQDRIRHGTQVRGESHGRRKLTEVEAREIRSSDERSAVIQRRYGVAQSTVSAIRNGRSWAWL